MREAVYTGRREYCMVAIYGSQDDSWNMLVKFYWSESGSNYEYDYEEIYDIDGSDYN